MQIFRQEFNNIPSSPIRQLYGQINVDSDVWLLVAPLDIIFMQSNGQMERFVPSLVLGSLLGASVSTITDVVGTIIGYDFPPTNLFKVKPLVLIQPDSNFNFGSIPKVGTSTVNIPKKGDQVNLILSSDLTVSGKIATDKIVKRSYPDPSSQVEAFRVNFNQNLSRQVHGARVMIGNDLLGMLIATQNQSDGTCHTLVFPADKVL